MSVVFASDVRFAARFVVFFFVVFLATFVRVTVNSSFASKLTSHEAQMA